MHHARYRDIRKLGQIVKKIWTAPPSAEETRITPSNLGMSIAALLLGFFLDYIYIYLESSMVLLSSGLFFTVVGIYSLIILIAWNSGGSLATVLRGKILNLIFLASILLLLIFMTVTGIIGL